jgi:flagellar hook-length control protein FliK
MEPPASVGDTLSAEGRRQAPDASDPGGSSDRSRRADGKEPKSSFKEVVEKAMAKDQQTDQPDEAASPDQATVTDAPETDDARVAEVSTMSVEGGESTEAPVVGSQLVQAVVEATSEGAVRAGQGAAEAGLVPDGSGGKVVESASSQGGLVAMSAHFAQGASQDVSGVVPDALAGASDGKPVASDGLVAGGDAVAKVATTQVGQPAQTTRAASTDGTVGQAAQGGSTEGDAGAAPASMPGLATGVGEGSETPASRAAASQAVKPTVEATADDQAATTGKIDTPVVSQTPDRAPRASDRPAEAIAGVGQDGSARQAEVRSDTGQARGELASEQGVEVRVSQGETAGAGSAEAFAQRLDSAMSDQATAEPGGAGASSPGTTVESVTAPMVQSSPARSDAPPMADQVIETLRMASRRVGEQVTIRLNPPELGRVRVQLDRDAGGLRGVIRVESAETMRELQREAADLMQRLSTDGVQVRRIEVVLETNDASRDGQESTGRQGGDVGFFGGDGEASDSTGQGGRDGRESSAASSEDGSWTDEASYGLGDEVVADESIDVAV